MWTDPACLLMLALLFTFYVRYLYARREREPKDPHPIIAMVRGGPK
jgi:hypothetical protein